MFVDASSKNTRPVIHIVSVAYIEYWKKFHAQSAHRQKEHLRYAVDGVKINIGFEYMCICTEYHLQLINEGVREFWGLCGAQQTELAC